MTDKTDDADDSAADAAASAAGDATPAAAQAGAIPPPPPPPVTEPIAAPPTTPLTGHQVPPLGAPPKNNWWRDHLWTTVIGDNNQDLHYLLEWASLAERETKWTAFQNDPDWIARRAETEKDGAIVAQVTNMILQPTSFSSVK